MLLELGGHAPFREEGSATAAPLSAKRPLEGAHVSDLGPDGRGRRGPG